MGEPIPGQGPEEEIKPVSNEVGGEAVEGSSRQEKREPLGGKEVWDRLAGAFGGYSQVPDRVVGMAIAGQINNGELSYSSIEECTARLDQVVEAICERWEDQDINSDDVRKEIIEGMKVEAKDWPEDNNVWKVLQSLGETK